MAIKFLFLILLLGLATSVCGSRRPFSIKEFQKLYPVVVVGHTLTKERNQFKVAVLRKKDSKIEDTIYLESKDNNLKPNENPEVGKVYIFFLKSKGMYFEIGRSLEISDYLTNDDELQFKALNTNCSQKTFDCLTK